MHCLCCTACVFLILWDPHHTNSLSLSHLIFTLFISHARLESLRSLGDPLSSHTLTSLIRSRPRTCSHFHTLFPCTVCVLMVPGRPSPSRSLALSDGRRRGGAEEGPNVELRAAGPQGGGDAESGPAPAADAARIRRISGLAASGTV